MLLELLESTIKQFATRHLKWFVFPQYLDKEVAIFLVHLKVQSCPVGHTVELELREESEQPTGYVGVVS